MREIERIDAVMEVLKPYWSDIEENFLRKKMRFLKLVATDHDFIGRVLHPQ